MAVPAAAGSLAAHGVRHCVPASARAPLGGLPLSRLCFVHQDRNGSGAPFSCHCCGGQRLCEGGRVVLCAGRALRARSLPGGMRGNADNALDSRPPAPYPHASSSASLPHGGVAQLVRALACHARGRGFESRHSRHVFNNLALAAIGCFNLAGQRFQLSPAWPFRFRSGWSIARPFVRASSARLTAASCTGV